MRRAQLLYPQLPRPGSEQLVDVARHRVDSRLGSA